MADGYYRGVSVKAEPRDVADGADCGGPSQDVRGAMPTSGFVYNRPYGDSWHGKPPSDGLLEPTNMVADDSRKSDNDDGDQGFIHNAFLGKSDSEQALLHKAILDSYSKIIDVQSLVQEFKVTLEKFGVSQRFAAKFIMHDSSQGNLSFLLEKGRNKKWEDLSPRGRIPYIKMKEWLDSKELQIHTLSMLKNCKEEKKVGLSDAWTRRERFSAFQQTVLCRLFEENQNPSMGTRSAVAEKLNIPLERVNVWFQNQRARGFPAKRILQQTTGAAECAVALTNERTSESPKSSTKNKGLPLFDYPKMLQQVTGYSSCSNTSESTSLPESPGVVPKPTSNIRQENAFPVQNTPTRKRKSMPPKFDYMGSPGYHSNNSLLEPYNPYFLTGTLANQVGINTTQLDQMTSALMNPSTPSQNLQKPSATDTHQSQRVSDADGGDSFGSFSSNLEKTINSLLGTGDKVPEMTAKREPSTPNYGEELPDKMTKTDANMQHYGEKSDVMSKCEPNTQSYGEKSPDMMTKTDTNIPTYGERVPDRMINNETDIPNYSQSGGNQLASVIERLSQQNQKSSAYNSSSTGSMSPADKSRYMDEPSPQGSWTSTGSKGLKRSADIPLEQRKISKRKRTLPKQASVEYENKYESFTTNNTNGITKDTQVLPENDVNMPTTTDNWDSNVHMKTHQGSSGMTGEMGWQKLTETNDSCASNESEKSLSSVGSLSEEQLEVFKAMCSSIMQKDNSSNLEEPDLD